MDHFLAEVDYLYAWTDGIHLIVRLEEAKACVLVLVGVRTDGSKELVALKDGYRERGESCSDLLHDCACRRMRGPGSGGRRRRSRLLKGPGRGLPRFPASKVLGAQNRQCAQRSAEVGPARRPQSASGHRHAEGRDLASKRSLRSPSSTGEVPQGRQEDH